MTKIVTLNIGPPHTPAGGMNTTARRQQIQPHQWVMARNVSLAGDAWSRRGGFYRLFCGGRKAASLKFDQDPANYVKIPYTDTAAIADYQFRTAFTVFVSYRPDSLSSDIMVASHSDDLAPPWRITHNTNGTITALVTQTGGTTATLTTPANYSKIGGEITVQLTRDGSTVTLQVNDDAAVTDTSTLTASVNTIASTESIYLGAWPTRASGSSVTYYEFRMFRVASTDKTWRVTQYPYSGRFGDPNMVCHLIFEEDSGTSVTDYSRINNESISVEGTGTWLTATNRQVACVVTGVHVMENALGRKWLLVDAGYNHYRVPIN